MKSKLLLTVVTLLLISNSVPIVAQEYPDEDEASLFAKIYCLFQRKEPKWELEAHGVQPNGFAIKLISREGRASVLVDIFSSEAVAKVAMKSRIELLERESEEDVFPPPARYSKVAMRDFGEESYLITNTKYWGTDILFRKGRYLISIYGQSENIARRFARHVANYLPPSNNSFNRSAR